MKLKALSTAMILATVPMTGAFAAAMDRSGQSIAAFLQPGNYFEAGISVLDADVSGRSTPLAQGLPSQDTGDVASDYYFPAAALKLQLTDNFSFGLLYDQPFGADVDYNTPNFNFTDANGGTSAEVTTENLTFLFGFQPNQNWNFYAGPVIQTAEGEVSLRGLAYGGPTAFGSYDATMKKDTELGWIAGLAYQIPEIALKASLTYRSEVKHELQATETVGYGATNLALNPAFTPGKTSVTTPQSVNLDFQTGVMADTVAFANVRWVNWKDFAIRPNYFGQAADARGLVGANLLDYSDDQISATLGVGRKVTDKWAGNVSVGYDTGAGNPVTTLGPTEGYWNLGVGVQYSPTPATFISGGVKYFWLGDATAKTAAVNNVGTFEDNNVIAYGLKMGYRF